MAISPLIKLHDSVDGRLKDMQDDSRALTEAEDAAGIIPVNYAYAPGNVLRYGADLFGTTDSGPAIQAAVDQCIEGGGLVFFPRGTYLVETSVVADVFDGLYFLGDGAVIDFQVDSCFKLGDHTVNGSLEYTQTTQTASDISFEGIDFITSDNGWDGDRFEHFNPIDLSAVEDVTIRRCGFQDWDFAAVNIGAPSKNVLVENCWFISSEESDVTYGVRAFAQIAGASTDNYDETDGTLAYAAPTSFHRDIKVRDCTFFQCSHSIMSWNVHGANYVNNEFRKPTVRTISVTAWNFDVLIQGNKHFIENNTTETVSTAIAVGVGSQRLRIAKEHFQGTLSGTGVNASMKLIDLTAVCESIIVEDCTADVTGCANIVVIGPNVEAKVRRNHFRQKSAGSTACIVINDQTASSVGTPGFHQPSVYITGNTDELSTRFVELKNEPSGGAAAKTIVITDNVLNTQLTDSFVVTNTTDTGWKVRARNNQFIGGAPTYCTDFDTGKTEFHDADDVALSGSTVFSTATSASVTLSIVLPSTSYKIAASANENKTFWVSSKTTTGWTWNASASSSATVDWKVTL